jgi:DNA-binding response OmpR family regulator
VLDLKMPLINGAGFLYRLRTCPGHSETPVLVVTGGSVNEEMRRDLAGLGAVIRTKPIGVEALITQVAALLNQAPEPLSFAAPYHPTYDAP